MTLTPTDNLEFSRLKLEVRTEVETWLTRLRPVKQRIEAGDPRMDVYQECALKCGVPVKTLIRKWLQYQKHGWRGLVNKAKAPIERGVGLPLLFINYWQKLMLEHQRDTTGRQARRVLLNRWRAWRVGDESMAIPGYDTPPAPAPFTSYPLGWSAPNLLRHGPSNYERRLRRQGTMAAKMLLPSVRTTRVGMEVGQMFMMDDQWHDTYVNLLGRRGEVINRRAMRPLSFNAIDLLSGCDFTRGYKPIIWDEKNQKRQMLTEADFFWFIMHVLTEFGWRADTGTVIVIEHGTASIQDAVRRAITAATDGKVTFQLGGIHGAPLKGLFFQGQPRGNFKIKAARESWFNLFRNHMSALPAPTGLGPEKAPEESYGLLQYNNTLLKVMEKLGPRAALLKLPVLPWQQYVPLADFIAEEINRREDHQLEGWEACGFVAQEVRLSPTDERWLTLPDIANLEDPKAQELALSLMAAPGHGRLRRLSPREVFDQGRRSLPFAKMNPHLWNLVIPNQYAHELRVTDRHEILVRDPALGAEPLCFTSCVRTARGREEIIPAGELVRVYVNPYRPQHALICEMNDAAIGLATIMDRPSRGDAEGMARQAGRVRHMEAILNRAASGRTQDIAEERAEMREHNQAVIDGEPVTDEERESAKRHRKAAKRSGAALDEEGAVEDVAPIACAPAPFDPLDE